jgi:hypothetical protein
MQVATPEALVRAVLMVEATASGELGERVASALAAAGSLPGAPPGTAGALRFRVHVVLGRHADAARDALDGARCEQVGGAGKARAMMECLGGTLGVRCCWRAALWVG